MSIFIDAHVHLYSEFSLDRFFAAAFNNFAKAAAKQSGAENAQYVLALTEGGAYDVFSDLYRKKIVLDDSFVVQKTSESNSLLISREKTTLILIAGRQLVSTENIELLSLFSPIKIEDKTLSLNHLAVAVSDNNGLPVVPWGVGKWFGSRGKVVADLLKNGCDCPLFFADNGNRPLLWPEPALLRLASESGIPLLSGSDPLPLASHETHPASFGSFIRDGQISMECPAATLKQLLLDPEQGSLNLEPFGCRTRSLKFVSDQLRINLRNRLPANASSEKQ